MFLSVTAKVHQATKRLGRIMLDYHTSHLLCAENIFHDKQRPIIYMICSLWHRHTYIGQTRQYSQRMSQHFGKAIRMVKRAETLRVQRCLHDLHPYHFFMVPLAQLPTGISNKEFIRVESLFIRHLQPVLNVVKQRPVSHNTTLKRGRSSPAKRRRHQRYGMEGTNSNVSPLENTPSLTPSACEIGTTTMNSWDGDTAHVANMARKAWIRLYSDKYLSSRHQTAVRCLSVSVLGAAAPPTVTARIQCALRTQGLLGQTQKPFAMTPFPFKGQHERNGTLTTFNVCTPEGRELTSNLVRTLYDMVINASPRSSLGHYVVTSAWITIGQRGTLHTRLKMCTFKHRIWCPTVILMVPEARNSMEVVTFARGIHALEIGVAAAIWLPFISPAMRVDPRLIVLLYDLVRIPSSTRWLLHGLEIEDILSLYQRLYIIRDQHWRGSAEGVLLQYLRRQWGIRPKCPLLFRIDCVQGVSTRVRLWAVAHTIVNSVTHDTPRLLSLMLRKLRIIIHSAPSLSRLLCNHVQAAKRFQRWDRPRCVCSELRTKFPNADGKGHLMVRGHTADMPTLRKVFGLSAATTVRPSVVDVDRVLFESVMSFYTNVNSWLGSLPRNDVRRTWVPSLETATAELPTWPPEWFRSIVALATVVNTVIPDTLWSAIAATRATILRSAACPKDSIVMVDQVREVKRMLGEAIICPLDRNMGELVVMCPVQLHTEFFNMFPATASERKVSFASTDAMTHKDSMAPLVVRSSCIAVPPVSTYRLCPALTETVLMNSWKERFSPFSHLGKLRVGAVPYAYVFPKNKDTTRYRPIVSYAKAPHRLILRTVARALFFIMQDLPVPHFTLWSAYKAKDGLFNVLNALHRDCVQRDMMNVQLRMLSLDIKDMYTALPHSAIRSAVAWCCDLYHQLRRRDRVNIAIRGKADGHRGRAYDMAQRREVLLQDVVMITDLNLQEAFFTAGDQFLLQRVGIPMGCPLSPALAICVCIHAECRVLSSTCVARPFGGIRYFDDLLLYSVVRVGANGLPLPGEITAAQQCLDMHSTWYPPSLRLIPQPASAQATEFLELIIRQRGDTVTTSYRNRNAASLLRSEPSQIIKRFMHGDSWVPAGQQLSTVCGLLYRVAEMESTPLGLISSTLLLILEFLTVGYSLPIIVNSLQHQARRHPLGPLWKYVISLLRKN